SPKASPTRSWRRWPADCRLSRRASGRMRNSSSTDIPGDWCPRAITRHWREASNATRTTRRACASTAETGVRSSSAGSASTRWSTATVTCTRGCARAHRFPIRARRCLRRVWTLNRRSAMCGIVGILDTRGQSEIEKHLLERMNETQLHRGPDAGGLHVEPGVGLGHRRLSIIDLSTGQQPMANADGSVVVIFNGEIYNFQALIPELGKLGYAFRTRSDTEAIIHAWEAWGESCVERLRGMFAFALWDRNRSTLFLARDRLGVKPLHYATAPDGR